MVGGKLEFRNDVMVMAAGQGAGQDRTQQGTGEDPGD